MSLLPGKWYAGDRSFLRIPIERILFANERGKRLCQHQFKDANGPTLFWSRRNAIRFAELLNEMEARMAAHERRKDML